VQLQQLLSTRIKTAYHLRKLLHQLTKKFGVTAYMYARQPEVKSATYIQL
jgi:hypothetical protein